MSGIPALDVVIGLVFIYLLYSLLASIIQEIIATNLGFRAKVLQKGIVRMLENENTSSSPLRARLNSWKTLFFSQDLSDKPFAKLFYSNPLIKYLAEDKWHSKPSYLGCKNFSKILLDILKGDMKPGEDIRKKIDAILYPTDSTSTDKTKEFFNDPNNEAVRYLRSMWAEAQGDVDKFKLLIENWFEETMERASGWYKRYTQIILFVIGLGIAISFNVDSIQIIKKLSKDPELRAQMVQYAGDYMKNNPDLEQKIKAQQARIDTLLKARSKDSATVARETALADSTAKELRKLNQSLLLSADTLIKNDIQKANDLLGLGWQRCDRKKCGCCFPTPNGGWSVSLIIGWILTALALSLGAPFWFDLLNKLMKMKGSVAKPEPPKENSPSNSTSPGPLQRKG